MGQWGAHRGRHWGAALEAGTRGRGKAGAVLWGLETELSPGTVPPLTLALVTKEQGGLGLARAGECGVGLGMCWQAGPRGAQGSCLSPLVPPRCAPTPRAAAQSWRETGLVPQGDGGHGARLFPTPPGLPYRAMMGMEPCSPHTLVG